MLEFKPTAKQRRQVAIAAGAGMSHEEIAIGLGISRPTLEKHFARELSVGAYEKRQEVLNALFKAAKDGNVSAGKAYLTLTPKVAAPPVDPEQKVEGVKAQRNADAAVAQNGTEWESLLKPTSSIQ